MGEPDITAADYRSCERAQITHSAKYDGPRRRRLPHAVPSWVPDGSLYFITLVCTVRGVNQLARADTARVLRDSLRLRQECGQWQVSLALLMPDHLHALIRFNPERGIQRTVLDWKRYTAKAGRIEWQQDFFEHRVRNEAACQDKWQYIMFNPVRAGLVKTPEEWPYVWANGQWDDQV